jgi:hypothetical protein
MAPPVHRTAPTDPVSSPLEGKNRPLSAIQGAPVGKNLAQFVSQAALIQFYAHWKRKTVPRSEFKPHRIGKQLALTSKQVALTAKQLALTGSQLAQLVGRLALFI